MSSLPIILIFQLLFTPSLISRRNEQTLAGALHVLEGRRVDISTCAVADERICGFRGSVVPHRHEDTITHEVHRYQVVLQSRDEKRAEDALPHCNYHTHNTCCCNEL